MFGEKSDSLIGSQQARENSLLLGKLHSREVFR